LEEVGGVVVGAAATAIVVTAIEEATTADIAVVMVAIAEVTAVASRDVVSLDVAEDSRHAAVADAANASSIKFCPFGLPG
jgi:hypothetical protein